MIVNLPHGFAPRIVEAPPERPRSALGEPRLTGRRVLLVEVDEVTGRSGYAHHHRATSEVFTEGGRRLVRVVDEATWQAAPGGPGVGRPWPAELVWIE